MERIAVYGSLKQGFYNHDRMLEGLLPVGQSSVKGRMYLAYNSYPLLVEDGTLEFPVEIYEIPTPIYQEIYRMEIGAGYYSKVVTFALEDGQSVKATVFFARPTLISEQTPEISEFTAATCPSAVTGSK